MHSFVATTCSAFLAAISTARPVKNGNDKKGGPPAAVPCPLPNPSDAQALGNPTAILAARLKLSANVVGGTCDVKATGRICLAVFEPRLQHLLQCRRLHLRRRRADQRFHLARRGGRGGNRCL
ncbi:unnamed protein product [Closterium sp. Yama58-4]|nr:unnamed protein product [Closterium sp. Yama58-4]